MKKIVILALMVLLASVEVSASVSIGIHGQYFSPADADFKSIYGGGLMGGGEISLAIAKSLDLWLDGAYFAKAGNLSYTGESTELTLIPIGVGLKYRVLSGKISPYVGAGAKYFVYRERNSLGEVTAGGFGFVGKIGLAISVSNHFGFDILAGYSSCKMKPADFEFNVGGLEFGAGLIISL